ncbi:hypothetical protein [Bacillus sp. 37MA]|uniref:hypothetical protein n=1 Tax=Bacillus sp. 37MA TaxID=1132442 RepID=UPI00037623BE|nr:hypothetical protein [Bacillus sp. 37MA]
MKTYVTVCFEENESNPGETIIYAGPSKIEAFSVEFAEKVYVWINGWEMEVYMRGEEPSSDKWILESNEVESIKKDIDWIEKDIENISKQLDERKLVLKEYKEILEEL